MDEQSRLAKQNKIFSIFEKNEKKMKKVLLAIVIFVLAFSSILSLTFSYKSYKKVKYFVNEGKKDEIETISYETLVVSYSDGSLLSCNESGCGATNINVFNTGDESIYYSISFVDVGGDNTYYEYMINSGDQNVQNSAPKENVVILKGVEIKPGETKDYKLSLNSVDGISHENYKMRLQINLDVDKNMFLE